MLKILFQSAITFIAVLIAIEIIRNYLRKNETPEKRMLSDYAALLTRIANYATPQTYYFLEQDIIRFNNDHTGVKGTFNKYKQLNEALYDQMVAQIPIDDIMTYHN